LLKSCLFLLRQTHPLPYPPILKFESHTDSVTFGLMAQRLQAQSLQHATSIRLSTSILLLLSTLSTSLHLPSVTRSINPHETLSTPISPSRFGHTLSSSSLMANPYNVTDECRQIFEGIIWPVYMGGGKTPEIHELQYRVFLKTYATRNDSFEILKTTLLKNVVPSKIYDQATHKGFVAKMSPQEVCDVYKLPIVCPVKVSPESPSKTNTLGQHNRRNGLVRSK
jgi:hypothetical protein